MNPLQINISECTEWHAWHDWMPGSAPTLHVKGTCQFDTDGYSVELRPVIPQGINPNIYLLEKIVHEPEGPVTDVITTEEVHYIEDTEQKYEKVHIMPDDISIDVQDVY